MPPRQKVKVSQTHPCRDFYDLGYKHGIQDARRDIGSDFGSMTSLVASGQRFKDTTKPQRKRMLNSWQKFVKANSKKPKYRKMNNTRRLKSLGIAYRKTAAYKRSKKK